MVDYLNMIDLDFAGRFENLESDWKHVAKIIDVSQEIPHANKGQHRTKKTDYTEYYDDDDIAVIRKRYKDDIKTFNYDFKKGN